MVSRYGGGGNINGNNNDDYNDDNNEDDDSNETEDCEAQRLVTSSGSRGMKDHRVYHHITSASSRHHHHHPLSLSSGGGGGGGGDMMLNGGRFCLRPGYYKCLSRTLLALGFIFVIWQNYSNCKAQEELCKMTRDSLEAIRATSIACQNIKEPVHMPMPTSAKLCDAVEDFNKLGKPNDGPVIYAITPTFTRPVQKAELTRLSQTFLLVPNFHWIVVEDSPKKTPLVTNFLAQSGLRYTHINAPTPSNYKLGKHDPNWKKPRGVEQRNAALRWIRSNLNESNNGVIFFADDDNTYSRHLFKEVAKVKRVGVWPVGLVGGLMVERPICDKATGKVTGFNAVWKPDRPFPIDMAGFGINLQVILEKKTALFAYDIQSGFQESEILKQVTTRDELEGLADGCTKVYVWHTRTQAPVLNTESILNKKGKSSNDGIEV
ncbi:galactosylgalactosylxylosylprotein 3-beta-glucuronosyltransferase I-like [Trichogramma pretiosum]|uniref:galactosylgalactosylxylosylprotein 3-beta-glucuronosyltransferase I-like n=1 Tax=Trichogramma pretiosum TaxID=7493 RepID=UPI0006C9D48F|nr:galactosylgalactosylxylosylprotein 3-beta-glucuronosyltransferase I-like [Trichogramma pretiosum]